jgi:hypothetical protein
MNKKPDSKREFALVHNPGYDFLRLIDWMQESESNPSASIIAPYFFPVLALLGACFAIEGYVSMVGQKLDADWEEFDKGRVTFKQKIKKIYSMLDRSIDFEKGIWQRANLMFNKRGKLAHPCFVSSKEPSQQKIPDIFDVIAKEYPPTISKEIAEMAIDILLADSNLDKFRHFSKLETYHGIPRD